MLTMVTGGARSGKSGFAEQLVRHEREAGLYIATAQAYDDEMRERIALHQRERESSGFVWQTLEEPHLLSGLLRRLGAGGSRSEGVGSGYGSDLLSEIGKPRPGAGSSDGSDRLREIGNPQPDAGSSDGSDRLREVRDPQPDAGAAGVTVPGVLVDCLTLWLSNRLLQLEREPDRDRLLGAEIDELVSVAASFPGRLTVVTNEVGSGIVPEYALGRLYRDWAGRLNRLMAERAERVFLVTAGIPVELKRLQYRFSNEGGRGGYG